MTEIQAKAVLELRLQRLTGMEIDKIREEHAGLMKEIERLIELLANEGMRFDIIKAELQEVREKFGDPRRSEIVYVGDDMNMLDFIEEEDVVVTISHLGYVKRTSATEYRQQRRGGRGSKGSSTRNEDYIEHLFVASTHHTLLFFTEKGRCFWLKVYEVPEGDKTSKGRAMQNLIQIPPDDKVRAIIDVKDFKDEEYVSDVLPFYNRIWTKPVTSYATNYKWFDVSLAPIKNHIFNRVKSQLKVIEAGFHKKAIIASNIGPYTIDLKHGLKNGEFTDGNALLVDEARNHSDWAKYMKKLIDNPNWAYDLGQRLYETVKDTYDLNKVTKDRSELYKSLIK